MLPKQKHFMAEIIAEDSPFIFMNQRSFSRSDFDHAKIQNLSLNSEMKKNFFAAYKYFLKTLATFSESQDTQNSFFSNSKFQLSSANRDDGLDLESSEIRE